MGLRTKDQLGCLVEVLGLRFPKKKHPSELNQCGLPSFGVLGFRV